MRKWIVLYILLLFALPYKEVCAASPWLYMTGHAGWLHYTVNGIAWLMCHPIITGRRVLVAWLLSVVAWEVLPNDPPALGWSVMIYFFLGMCLCGRNRMTMLVPTVAGFFIPGIAAWHHLTMLLLGYVYRKVEKSWARTGY